LDIISAVNISKTFKQGFFNKNVVKAIDNLSLSVPEGQVFGLLGPNGAGKTTFIKVLLNIVFPSKGSAHLFGLPVGNPESRREVGYLPESPYFYDRMNAWQLLEFYGAFHGIKGIDLVGKSEEILELVGLTDAAKRPLRTYSKGMLQRIGLAQAIFHKPKLVFLDEPSTGLDPMGRKRVKDIIKSLKDTGITILLNSHILADVQDTCDTVGIIHKGRLLKVAAVKDLTINQHIVKIRLECIADDLVQKLKQHFESFSISNGNVIEMGISSPEKTPEIVRLVVEAGGRIYEVRYQETSLEDIFVKIISEEDK
jgi:ABC-2 type transport system ATP-binding protein